MKRIQNAFKSNRRGITRFDVVVALIVIALILTVVSPAILQQRPRTARKLECLCNMRNVGLAIISYSVSTEGQLPMLADELNLQRDSELEAHLLAGWPIFLLPALDSTAVLKNIKRNAIKEKESDLESKMVLAESEKIWMPFFTCPQDADSFRKPGGLSFVINAGFISRDLYHGDPDGLHQLGRLSWDGNNISNEKIDIEIGAATGVFWRKSDSFTPSLDYVATGDGVTTTIMITENLNAGLWYDTDTSRIAFALPVNANDRQVPFGSGTFFKSLDQPLNTEFPGDTLATANPKDWRINCDPKATMGTRPRPSSNHKGGVNVIFCDGHGTFLSDTIDPHVYVKLITSNGVSYGEGFLPEKAY